MLILSHRGYWRNSPEKNQPVAFQRSVEADFGIETDVRDCAGRLVISHDMPAGQEMTLQDFLAISQTHPHLPLAINIKSDGLVNVLKQAMHAAGCLDWFVFDMSIPDMRSYLKAGVPVFARMSEVEKNPPWIDEIAGIWLDSFVSEWYNVDLIESLLKKGLRVCVVSSELHGRAPQDLWGQLKSISKAPGLMLCTDFPEEAKNNFKEVVT